jgi:hypothetical protein
MAKFSEWLFGSKDKIKQVPTMTGDQQQMWQEYFMNNRLEDSPLYQSGANYLQGILGGDTEAFEAPLMRQFNEQIIPGIAERYAGIGGLSSSGFQQSMGQAGSGLAELLAKLRGELGLEASRQGASYAQLPYTNALQGMTQNAFQNVQIPGGNGLFGGLAQGAGNRMGSWI